MFNQRTQYMINFFFFLTCNGKLWKQFSKSCKNYTSFNTFILIGINSLICFKYSSTRVLIYFTSGLLVHQHFKRKNTYINEFPKQLNICESQLTSSFQFEKTQLHIITINVVAFSYVLILFAEQQFFQFTFWLFLLLLTFFIFNNPGLSVFLYRSLVFCKHVSIRIHAPKHSIS